MSHVNLRDPRDPLESVYGPARFRAAYVAAARRLAALPSDRESAPAYAACETLLKGAREAARPWWRNVFRHPTRLRKLYVAWDCLHQFDRTILPLATHAERVALWQTARAEARAKLAGWRDGAAAALIERGDAAFESLEAPKPRRAGSIDTYLAAQAGGHADDGTETLRELLQHLHTQSQNTCRKIEMVSAVLPWLFVLLLVVVFGVLWLAFNGALDGLALDPERPDIFGAAFLGVLGGVLGGVISMVLGLGKVNLAAKVPELRLSRITLLIRPLLGAAAALPVAFAANADFIQINGLSASMTVFLLAIATGFSERLFMALVERVGGKSSS